MSELLIDDSGKVWPVEPETIARRFDGLRCRRDFVAQGVALGFIFVRFCECGARIALRPQLASQSAVSRLFGIIGQRNPTRVALARDVHLSPWELIIGPDRGIARIGQLIAEARNPSPRPLLIDERLPLERCRDIAGGQLLPVLQVWHQIQGRWEADLYERLEEFGLLANTTILRQARGSERLLIEHWGANLRMHDKDWPRVARGRDFEDHPNAELGRARGVVQRQTIAEHVPQLAKSDHVVRRIDGALVRSQFLRLGLPWQTSDGAVLVTGIRVARHTVVLERPDPANRFVQEMTKNRGVIPASLPLATERVVSTRKTLGTLATVKISALLIDDTGAVCPVEPDTIARRFDDLQARRIALRPH